MKGDEMRQLKDLYFGVMVFGFNRQKMEKRNLFQSSRVLRSVAMYRAERDRLEISDPLRWCFGDTHGRVQWEVGIGSPFEEDASKYEKKSIYELYVEPNRALLMDIVNSASVASCKKYLKEERERRK